MNIRIQIACSGKLTAECIVEEYMANNVWSKWAIARYKANKPIGGAIMQQAALPRYWNVLVGGYIYQ